VITSTKSRYTSPLEMGRKSCWQTKGTSKHSKTLGLKSFQNMQIRVKPKEVIHLVLKIRECGERTKKVIRPLCETMNENPKCQLHIPQLKKGIYVLNIIIQCLL
jgi:hypothetical protein